MHGPTYIKLKNDSHFFTVAAKCCEKLFFDGIDKQSLLFLASLNCLLAGGVKEKPSTP